MLDLVRLSGLGARRPAQLSGGQQQRVALARALAIEPQLLLLDEPLSNLDAKLRGALQAELRGILTRVGTTTLIVTHDQEEAMALADRIAIMSQGRVLQLGTAREVYERPACRFVAEFLGSALWLEGRVEPGGFVTARGTALACAPPSRVAARHGLLVRPEALRIGAAPEGWNALSAQVTGARYRGAVTLLDLLVDGAAPASIELERGTSPPPPGATLALAAAPADCILVPEEARG